MNTTIVYLDDADYATQHIAALRRKDHAGQAADPRGDGGSEPSLRTHTTHWVLVGCAPRMTHRISKWVSHSARENWRNKWADKLFGQAAPWLEAQGGSVTTLVAKGPLTELTERLLQDHPGARVLDARRPKLGQDLPPVAFPTAPAASAAATEKPTSKPAPWALPGTAMALLGSLLLVTE